MDYLFFDIECANCFNSVGKICEFGYILTDDSFNVIEKKQIIINPESAFDRYALKNILTYEKSEYKSALSFPTYYQDIKNLLLNKDRIIFGHATSNDARYLRDASIRYSLEYIDFEFCDVGKLYKSLNSLKDATSLKKMCENLEITTDELSHIAANDAVATMLVLKSLCTSTKKSPSQLIEKFPDSFGKLVLKDKSKGKNKKKKDQKVSVNTDKEGCLN